jgi:hypothetical protein
MPFLAAGSLIYILQTETKLKFRQFKMQAITYRPTLLGARQVRPPRLITLAAIPNTQPQEFRILSYWNRLGLCVTRLILRLLVPWAFGRRYALASDSLRLDRGI